MVMQLKRPAIMKLPVPCTKQWKKIFLIFNSHFIISDHLRPTKKTALHVHIVNKTLFKKKEKWEPKDSAQWDAPETRVTAKLLRDVKENVFK